MYTKAYILAFAGVALAAPQAAYDTTAPAAEITSTVTLSSSAPSASATGSVNCVDADNACRTAPNANQAFCSSEVAGCKSDCYDAYDVCRGAPDANRATCASEFAECLGENPFNDDGTNTVTPGAFIPGQGQQETASATVVVSESYASAPPAPTTTGDMSCVDADNACRTAPNANQAFCSSEVAGCKSDCYDSYNDCRGAPDANRATCASEFAECLGENPFNDDGTNTVTPGAFIPGQGQQETASATLPVTESYAPAPTATGDLNCVEADNACRTAPNANQAFCSSEVAGCKSDCYDSYNDCRSAPDANRATCASEYAECLGENPFNEDGTNTVTPGAFIPGQGGEQPTVTPTPNNGTATVYTTQYTTLTTCDVTVTNDDGKVSTGLTTSTMVVPGYTDKPEEPASMRTDYDNTKPAETQPPAYTKPDNTKPVETQPAYTKPDNTKPAENTQPPAYTKPDNTKPAENTQPPAYTKPDNTQPANNTQPAYTKPDNTQPAENTQPPAYTKPDNTKPAENTQPPAYTKPDNTQPAENTQPAYTRPDNTKPVETVTTPAPEMTAPPAGDVCPPQATVTVTETMWREGRGGYKGEHQGQRNGTSYGGNGGRGGRWNGNGNGKWSGKSQHHEGGRGQHHG